MPDQWEIKYHRLRRVLNKKTLGQLVRGGLKSAIHDHGPIAGGDDINSASKRIASQIMAHAEKNFISEEELNGLLQGNQEE